MQRSGRTRSAGGRPRAGWGAAAAVAALAASVVTAVPGVAHAADGLPPRQPLTGDLQTAFKACATGGEPAYVPTVPVVTAVLHDPEEDDGPAEGNTVAGDFEAWWTDASGTEQRRTHSSYPAPSGTVQRWQLPPDVPADTVVSWHVRANDGTAASAWSSEGTGAACRFVIDQANPEKPAVASDDYPAERYSDGVGRYGSFVVDSPSPDVVAYQYNFIGGPQLTALPAEPGGPATLRFLPQKNGPDYLSVWAVDRAGRRSTTTTHHFFVNAGRAPVAHWKLADPAGSAHAAAETGAAARAGSGVVFGGPAPAGTTLASTAALDGSRHGFLTTDAPAVDTRGTFAVSAWVRPARTDRTMTVAGQDTADGAAFTLGLRARSSGPVWSFALGGARVSGGAPETGEWAHLLGLYDSETGTARLYVNGRETGTPVQASPAASTGAFQLGRAHRGSGYGQRWQGDLGDVRVHDRVVVAAEAARLAHRQPKRLGRWSLETAADGTSPDAYGGAPLRLGGGASVHRGPDGSCVPDLDPECPVVPYALVGDGHLSLDGASGHAVADGPVVDTSDSFTLGVVARLADRAPAGPMTVLSLPGRHADAFQVRYDPAGGAWQLVVTERDEAGAPERIVSRAVPADGGEGDGHRLAVVYDDANDTVTLYLDGYAEAGTTATLPRSWRATGPLQVGRGLVAGAPGAYLRGDVDEIQAYAGALSPQDVTRLGWGGQPCLC
ncbi:LamG domain-containing protein [Streptomyces omiyaensis]|uniref:LamG-like jellyroll fold domain-containing protein n=1 Tax=Streptomyces omiyaensis TaxID=68247 RepID=A0ABW7BZQ8_9ACTN